MPALPADGAWTQCQHRHVVELRDATPTDAYALATVLLRSGDREGARAAAAETLRLNPGNVGARRILVNFR